MGTTQSNIKLEYIVTYHEPASMHSLTVSFMLGSFSLPLSALRSHSDLSLSLNLLLQLSNQISTRNGVQHEKHGATKKSLMIACYNSNNDNNKGENCIVFLYNFWSGLARFGYAPIDIRKSWCVLNFECQFYVISSCIALDNHAVWLQIVLAFY